MDSSTESSLERFEQLQVALSTTRGLIQSFGRAPSSCTALGHGVSRCVATQCDTHILSYIAPGSFSSIKYSGMTFTHGPDALEDAWQWNIIRTGELGVDMFFVLSGFLIHHLLSKEFEETGRINYFRFLARRWLRLWPAYVVIFPLYLINAQSRAECERWWWTNLLMINNYVGPGAETGGCMGHTWSIAVEFQFYCVSPLLVWMMHSRQCPLLKGRWPTLIPVGIALMSALVRAVLYVYDINHISEMLDQDDIQTGGAEIYAPMYTRLGPYAVGMVTSYLFQQWKQAQQQLPNSYVPMSAITNTNGRGCTLSCVHIAHVLAFLVWATLSLIGPKPVWGADFRAPLPGQDPVWSQALAVVYVAFSRTSFGVAVAWGIYSCLTGKAFFLNKLLSAKAFAPIARLSYSTYLVQFAGVKPAEAVFKTAIAAISTPTAALPVLLGIWSMTFAIAFPLAFCVYMAAERPMMKLRPV